MRRARGGASLCLVGRQRAAICQPVGLATELAVKEAPELGKLPTTTTGGRASKETLA